MNRPRATAAFSLVEVTVALGIASFALLAVFALLPAGIGAHHSAMQQTAAANLATAITADLRCAKNSASPRYGLDPVATAAETLYLSEYGAKVDSPEDASFKAVVTLTTSDTTRRATSGTVVVSWPAIAPRPVGATTVFISLDRN
ncbi:MAG: hypothetical protein LBK60_06190 [Verrucomicrobiales bacterium]|jgi:uncharacterized protein (TIGR02598 family)|nr:hypothetical protein [Verrucomicrobiales bacterium]